MSMFAGTGTGRVVEALLGRFDDIIAIDNDSDMLGHARRCGDRPAPGAARVPVQRVWTTESILGFRWPAAGSQAR